MIRNMISSAKNELLSPTDYERFANQMAMNRAIELLGEYKGLLK